MKVGKEKIRVYDPIFKQEVLVLLNHTEEDYRKVEKTLKVSNPLEFGDKFSGWTTHITSEDEPPTYVIFIPNFDWTINDQATLIHEVVHVVFRIWGSNNISVVPDNQEFLAHSIDKLFAEISYRIFKRSKKNEKKK